MEDSAAIVTYYRDKGGKHRWRFQSPNGNVLGDSGEGYERSAGAINGFHAFCHLVGGNPANVTVEIEETP